MIVNKGFNKYTREISIVVCKFVSSPANVVWTTEGPKLIFFSVLKLEAG